MAKRFFALQHEAEGRLASVAVGAFKEHRYARLAPTFHERGLYGMIESWALYADNHAAKKLVISDDGVLGPAWKGIGEHLLTLLNGDIGRFDGGTLDRLIRAIAAEHGCNLDE